MPLPYSEIVMEHFRHPHNVGRIEDPDAKSIEGSPACGDMVAVYLKVDPEKLRITDIKSECGCTVPDVPKRVIAPGDSTLLKITFSSKHYKGDLLKRVTIVSNDPASPQTRVKVKDTVLQLMRVDPEIVQFGDVMRGTTPTETIMFKAAREDSLAIEEVLRRVEGDPWFWATHQGAELDLLLLRRGDRLGFEFKRSDAPQLTKSMRIALDDLALDKLFVVYPGDQHYRLHERVEAIPLVAVGKEF